MNDRRRKNPATIDMTLIEFDYDLTSKERKLLGLGDDLVRTSFENTIGNIKNLAVQSIVGNKTKDSTNQKLSQAVQQAYQFVDNNEIDYTAQTFFEIVAHYYNVSVDALNDNDKEFINAMNRKFVRDEIKFIVNGSKKTPYYNRHIKSKIGLPIIEQKFSEMDLTEPENLYELMKELQRITIFLKELPLIQPLLFKGKDVNMAQISDDLFVGTVNMINKILKEDFIRSNKSKDYYKEKWFQGDIWGLLLYPLREYTTYLSVNFHAILDQTFTGEILNPLTNTLNEQSTIKRVFNWQEAYNKFSDNSGNTSKFIGGKLQTTLFSFAVNLFKEYWSNKGTAKGQYFKKGYQFISLSFGTQNKYSIEWNAHLPHYVIARNPTKGIEVSKGSISRKVYYSSRYLDNATTEYYAYAINILQDIFAQSILNTDLGRDKILKSSQYSFKQIYRNEIGAGGELNDRQLKEAREYAYKWIRLYTTLHKDICPNYEDGLYIQTSQYYNNNNQLLSLVNRGLPSDSDALNVSVFDFDTGYYRISDAFNSFDKYFRGKTFYKVTQLDNKKRYWSEVKLKADDSRDYFQTVKNLRSYTDGIQLISYPRSNGMQLSFIKQFAFDSFRNALVDGEILEEYLPFLKLYGLNFKTTKRGFKPELLSSENVATMFKKIREIETKQALDKSTETLFFNSTSNENLGTFSSFYIPSNISPQGLLTFKETKTVDGKRVTQKVSKVLTIQQIQGLKRAKKEADKRRKEQEKKNLDIKLDELEEKYADSVKGDFESCRERFDSLNGKQLSNRFSYKDALADKEIARAWSQIKYSLSEDTLKFIEEDRKNDGRFEELLVAKTKYFVEKIRPFEFKPDELGTSFNIKKVRAMALRDTPKQKDEQKTFKVFSDSATKYVDLGNLVGKFAVYRETTLSEEINFDDNSISIIPRNEVYLFLFTEMIIDEEDKEQMRSWVTEAKEADRGFTSFDKKYGTGARFDEPKEEKEQSVRKNPSNRDFEEQGEYTCGILQDLAMSGFFFDFSDSTHGKNTSNVGTVFDFIDVNTSAWKIQGDEDYRSDYLNFKRYLGRHKPKDIFPTSIQIPNTSGFVNNSRKNVLLELAGEDLIKQEQFDEIKNSKGIFLRLKHIPLLCNALDQKGLYDLSIALRIMFMKDPTFRSCTEQSQLQGKAFIDEISDKDLQRKVRGTTKGLKAKDGIILTTEIVGGVPVKVPKLDKRNKPIHFTPYPYQKIGIYFAKMLGFKCLIGDDMGLGKTVQAMCSIKVAERLHKENPSKHPSPFPCVVVAPAGVAPKWVSKELNIWFPEYKATLFSQSKMKNGEITKENKVIVTSYNGLYLSKDVFNFWIGLKPNMFIFDEAHRIKNYKTTGCMYAMIYMGIQLENRQLEEFLNVEKNTLPAEGTLPTLLEDDTDAKKVILWDIKKYGSIMKNRGKFRGSIAPYRILLTGTPIENKYQEAYVILRLLNPEKFQNYDDFDRRFNPKQKDEQGVERTDINTLKLLKAEINCVMIRRFKKEVFTGRKGEDFYFPTKDRFPLMVNLPKKAQKTYNIVSEMLYERMNERRLQIKTELAAKWFLGTTGKKDIEQITKLFYMGKKKSKGDDIKPNKTGQRLLGNAGKFLSQTNDSYEIKDGKVIDRKNNRSFFVKKDITSAVEIANDSVSQISDKMKTQLEDGEGMNAKMDLVRIIGKAKVQSAKIFIDKFFNEPEQFVEDYYKSNKSQTLLTDIADHIKIYERKVKTKTLQLVVFIKHKAVSEQLKEACEELNLTARIVAGNKGQMLPNGLDERSQNIDDFQNGLFKVLIGSKAIREGINLYSANHMLFVELWWVPTQIEQAEDRIWRIGQQNPCSIFYLIGNKTIDEEVYAKLDAKKGLITALVGMEDIVQVEETEDQEEEVLGDILNEKFLENEKAKKLYMEKLGTSNTTEELVADYLEVPLFLCYSEPDLARQYAKKRKVEKVLLTSVSKKDAGLVAVIPKINELLALSYLNAFKKVFGTEATNYKKAGTFLRNKYIKYQNYPMEDVTWLTRYEVDKKIVDIQDFIFYIFKIDISMNNPDLSKAYIDFSSVNLELCRKFYKELNNIALRISGEKRVKIDESQQEFLERLVLIKSLWDTRELSDREDKRKTKETLEKKLRQIATMKGNKTTINKKSYTKEEAIEFLNEKIALLSEPTLANRKLRKEMQDLIDDVGYSFDNKIIDSSNFTRQQWWDTLNEIPLQGSTVYRNVYQLLRKQIEYSDPAAVYQSIPKKYISVYLKKINSVLSNMKKLLFLER